MDKELIERLYEQLEWDGEYIDPDGRSLLDALAGFAALVAEECAKVAEEGAGYISITESPSTTLRMHARVIRERFKP